MEIRVAEVPPGLNASSTPGSWPEMGSLDRLCAEAVEQRRGQLVDMLDEPAPLGEGAAGSQIKGRRHDERDSR